MSTRRIISRRGPTSGFAKIGVIIALILAVALIGTCANAYYAKETVTFTVKDKESVAVDNGNGGTKNEYRVYTSKGTFKVGDTLVYTRFDSSDQYAALDKGKTYRCEVYGFRLPFFSKFKNILECKEAHNG